MKSSNPSLVCALDDPTSIHHNEPMKTRLVIQALEFQGHCGVLQEERHKAQPILVDAEATLALPPPSRDDLKETVDYLEVAERIIQLGSTREFQLLETLADRVCYMLLSEFPMTEISLWVRKKHSLLPAVQGSMGIRVRYDRGSPIGAPLPARFLQESLSRLPGGSALDIACGSGRNTLYLAAHGYHVDAVDYDGDALAHLQKTARAHRIPHVSVQRLDMETGDGPPEFPAEHYDLILVFFYLYRPLFPALLQALKPGGVLLYETFLLDNHLKRGHPRRREFCLAPNELLHLTPGMRLLHYDEGEHQDYHGKETACTAQLMACKDARDEPN